VICIKVIFINNPVFGPLFHFEIFFILKRWLFTKESELRAKMGSFLIKEDEKKPFFS
jgi:hypothetical protein